MKKLKIDLDTKSIDKAIKEIEKYKKRLKEFLPRVINACAEEIIELANENIDMFEYDDGVIAGIQNGWKLPVEQEDDETFILENTYDKAVYIEFGVGKVGMENAHEQAKTSGYDYDVNAHGDSGWGFYIGDEPLDLQLRYYKDTFKEEQNKFWIWTKGSPATMFLYNAAMRFAESNKIGDIAKKVMKELDL